MARLAKIELSAMLRSYVISYLPGAPHGWASSSQTRYRVDRRPPFLAAGAIPAQPQGGLSIDWSKGNFVSALPITSAAGLDAERKDQGINSSIRF